MLSQHLLEISAAILTASYPLIMKNQSQRCIIDGDRVFKATNVKIKTIHPVFLGLAESLSNVSILRFIKIYNDKLCASNLLSIDGKILLCLAGVSLRSLSTYAAR